MPGKPHHTAEFKSCVDAVIKKGNDESSAYAICTTQFKESDKAIFEAATRNLHLAGALGKSRIEKWQGRDHLVVPIVALVEGVIHAVNAENPEYVDRAVLEKAKDSWNGMPIMHGHPRKNGQAVSANEPGVRDQFGFGVIRNSEFKDGKLGMEGLIDIEKLSELDPNLLEELRNGSHVEVSVGALVRTAKKEGEYKKKKYKGAWLEIYGDHVAMLPGGIGACSGEMGCGANRHCHFVTAEGFVEEKIVGLPYMAFTALEDQSFEQRMRAIEEAVRKKWPHENQESGGPYGPMAWPIETFDDHIIVRYDADLFRCDYTVNENGDVILGEPRKVKQVYVNALGRQHSQKHVEIIQGVHDHTMALGAKCDAANCIRDMQQLKNRVRIEGGRWSVFSTDGTKCLSVHDSEAEAVAHAEAIDRARQRRVQELAGVKP